MKWVAVEPAEAALAQEMSVVGFVHKAGGQNALHGSSPLLQRRQLRVPNAINDMVIDHPSRLHKSVANRRSYELKAALSQILAHRILEELGMSPMPRLEFWTGV